jgi:hypothetical protein
MTKKPVSISGKQQRPSFSDPERTLFGISKQQSRTLLGRSAPISADDFCWGFEINGQPIPPLTNRWFDKVEAACPASMTENSRQQLRGAVDRYLSQRFAIATSTSHRDQTSKLAKIERTAKALLAATEVHDHGDVLAWQVLEATAPPILKRDAVYPLISLLVNRAHIASAASKARSQKTQSTFRPNRVWENFVKGLVAAFEANNWEVKISKSKGNLEGVETAHPSTFVNFAWAVLDAIPKELREHSSSRWTLADALHSVTRKPKVNQ